MCVAVCECEREVRLNFIHLIRSRLIIRTDENVSRLAHSRYDSHGVRISINLFLPSVADVGGPDDGSNLGNMVLSEKH